MLELIVAIAILAQSGFEVGPWAFRTARKVTKVRVVVVQ